MVASGAGSEEGGAEDVEAFLQVVAESDADYGATEMLHFLRCFNPMFSRSNQPINLNSNVGDNEQRKLRLGGGGSDLPLLWLPCKENPQ